MKMKVLLAGMALALALPFAASAATVLPGGGPNDYTVNYNPNDGSDNIDLGELNLTDGDIFVTGLVANNDANEDLGSLAFTIKGPNAGLGGLQIIVGLDQDKLVIDTASIGGNPIMLTSSSGLVSGMFTVDLSNGDTPQFLLEFSNASAGGVINISVTAVPVPAAGFLLLGGLGGLAALKRRKKA